MKDIKVLILEDKVTDASYLKDVLLQLGYKVPAVASSLSEGLEYFSIHQPDISLIDIYLDGKPDGVVFGLEMNRSEARRKPFVFLTGSADMSTFKLAKVSLPYHYLIKPFNKPELQYSIELALDKYQAEKTTPPVTTAPASSVFVKRGNTLVRVQYDEIKYIEVDGKYSKIHCYNQNFVVQQPLGDLYETLPNGQFFRIHRRYVINLKEITKIDTVSHELFFKDGNTLFFSRRYLDEFLSISNLIK